VRGNFGDNKFVIEAPEMAHHKLENFPFNNCKKVQMLSTGYLTRRCASFCPRDTHPFPTAGFISFSPNHDHTKRREKGLAEQPQINSKLLQFWHERMFETWKEDIQSS
jgi:hypothetical protein